MAATTPALLFGLESRGADFLSQPGECWMARHVLKFFPELSGKFTLLCRQYPQPICCAISVGSTRSAKAERPDEASFASLLGRLH